MLCRDADANLNNALGKVGFTRRRKLDPYVRTIGPDGMLLVYARVTSRHRVPLIEPLVALENRTLRAALGESPPPQTYPRFASVFLAYLMDRTDIAWRLSTSAEMPRAIEEIANAVVQRAIPFADRWCRPRDAQRLIRLYLGNRGPKGVFIHPWPVASEQFSPAEKSNHRRGGCDDR